MFSAQHFICLSPWSISYRYQTERILAATMLMSQSVLSNDEARENYK